MIKLVILKYRDLSNAFISCALYISGLTAFGTAAQHEGIAEQAEEIFSQIRKIVSLEEIDFSALIKVTIFITSFEEINGLRNVLYRNYLITCQPARS
jgi:2-iminobutanoate/2-iminopropanoate deaminase